MISGIFLVVKYSKRRTLSTEKSKYFLKILHKIATQVSSKSKIIDYDKLYHKILNELGYDGTFGDALKLEPKEVKNINNIWNLHKLRNKIVHDFDSYDEKYLKHKAHHYEKEIKKLLKNVSN
ncbi:hypothetical protein A9Q91_05560 [Candidatus Gracilibacteria bacterium 28_42_T64]|nr:hypothetical protein A9Q91_05560 [Candidatus Gracilibacteria bacterium 28_42_T64]